MHPLWLNKLSEDGLLFEEAPKPENKKVSADEHLSSWLSAPSERRITLLRYADDLGFCFYRFVGVFSLNREMSREKKKCIRERISDRYELDVFRG